MNSIDDVDVSSDMKSMVDAFNQYIKDMQNLNTSPDGKPIIDTRGGIESSSLEEFVSIIVNESLARSLDGIDQKIWKNRLSLKGTHMPTQLFAVPADLKSAMTSGIEYQQNTKNADVAVLLVNGRDRVPVIAAEVKTYIEKTMWSSIVATAGEIRTGPFHKCCKYLAVTSGWDVDDGVNPTHTAVDGVFILGKSRRRIVRASGIPTIIDVEPAKQLSKVVFDHLSGLVQKSNVGKERGFWVK